MAPKGIAAPRALLLVLLTLVVGALHWWLLRDLTRSTTATPAPTPSAPVFETRSIAPPTPPPPAPSAVVASPKPKPAPPKPKPKPVPPPPSAPIPEAIEPIAEVAVPAEAPALPPPPDMSAQDSSTAASEETATPAPPPATDAFTDGAALATETTSPTPPSAPPDEAGKADGAAESVTASATPTGILLHTAGQTEQTDLPYQAPPAQLLQFKVQGQAKGFEYGASAQLLWQPQGNTYQASQEVSAFLLGTRAQSSRGHITDSGLQPERFEDRARKKLRAATLDWASGMARFEPEAPSAPIAAGTQDRLSVFLQLAGMVAAAPQRYPAGATISVPTASTRGLQTWVFQVHDTPRLDLPAGVLETVRLERLPQGGRDQKAELWLAPALGYLPVRIRLSESNGDYADLRLQSHSAP